MAFELQVKQTVGRVWHCPDRSILWGKFTLRAGTISALRETIDAIANTDTFPYTRHWRIITTDGDPVERWKTKPGWAKKAWRKQ